MKQLGPGGQEAGPGQAGPAAAAGGVGVHHQVSGSSVPVSANGATNFEYEDSEWDVGIGSLIIDLDADIEKNNGESVKDKFNHHSHHHHHHHHHHHNNNNISNNNNNNGSNSSATAVMPSSGSPGSAATTTTPLAVHSATVEQGLKMKIKRTKPGPGTRSSEPKHEIVKPVADKRNMGIIKPPPAKNNNPPSTVNGLPQQQQPPQQPVTVNTGSGVTVTPVARLPAPRNPQQPVNGSVAVLNFSSAPTQPVTVTPVSMVAPTVKGAAAARTSEAEALSPPNKKWKTNAIITSDKIPETSQSPSSGISSASSGLGTPSPAGSTLSADGGGGCNNGRCSKADACVGTSSAMTMTEPECLGPCEPGTAVTLEGIVWHETEGGVLVVNVTWRGKTYVGTLLDCTRHDWAPPRFCDSPTSDVDSRAPKGRAKRGRGASSTPVPGGGAGASGSSAEANQSPMHSKLRNGAKGRRGGVAASAAAAPPSPVKETSGSGTKRKGKSYEEPAPSSNGGGNGPSSNKRSRSSSRGAGNSSPTPEPPSQPPSPMLIECPEPNCSKKYRHINGLKYHQSHAHGTPGNNNNAEEDSNPESKEEKAEEPVETAPFTGKVPIPPGQVEPAKEEEEETPAPETTPAPTPSPSPAPASVITTSSPDADPAKPVSRNSVAPVTVPVISTVTATGVPPVTVPEHVFAPIVAATATPTSTVVQAPPARVSANPLPVTPGVVVVSAQGKAPEDADLSESEKIKKHKKKSKDKEKEKPKDPSRKIPEQPVNGHATEGDPSKKDKAALSTPPADSGREEVQSPAYSDISDAGDQPPIDGELADPMKKEPVKVGDPSNLGSFVFPFYNHQAPFMVNPATIPEKKEERREVPAEKPAEIKHLPPSSYYPQYGYMPPFQGYPIDPPMVDPNLKNPERISPPRIPVESNPNRPKPQEEKEVKVIKDSRTPLDLGLPKVSQSSTVVKKEPPHFLAKEPERKPAPFEAGSVFSRQQEELRRMYTVYPGGDPPPQPTPSVPAASPGGGNWSSAPKQTAPTSKAPTSAPSPKVHPPPAERKERETKNEGVKPTMETHGPPPPVPPQSSMSGPHIAYPYLYPYPTIPIDPGHPAYRVASMMPPHFLPPHPHGGPHPPQGLQPGLRYPFPPPGGHVNEDLSRAHFELLHNNPYYAAAMAGAGAPPPHSTAHKIHELAERAIKSPPTSSGMNRGVDPGSGGADSNKPPSNNPGNSSASAPKMAERRSPAPGPPRPMIPGAGHQMPGFLPPLPGSQYPPSSYGGKPLLRP